MKNKTVATILAMAMCIAFALCMSGCKEEEIRGEFYSLEQAYNAEYISKDDLLSIAYYKSGRFNNEELMGEDYKPSPKKPAELSTKMDLAIRKDFLAKYCIPSNEGVNLEQVWIGEKYYYGTYNSAVAVMVWRSGDYEYIADEVIIDSVYFLYANDNRILIWIRN